MANRLVDTLSDLGQAGKTVANTVSLDEKTRTDSLAPLIGSRTLQYTTADLELRKADTRGDNTWRQATATAWANQTTGDLVARGNLRRTLANNSGTLADSSQANIAQLKATWWQGAIPSYLQWSDDVGAVCKQNHLERPATVAISAESCDNRLHRFRL